MHTCCELFGDLQPVHPRMLAWGSLFRPKAPVHVATKREMSQNIAGGKVIQFGTQRAVGNH